MYKKEINNSDTNRALFKNTGIIAIGQISTKVINFLLLPLYTSLLTKTEYGLVDLLSTYASFIIVVVGLQMSQAMFRFLVTCRDDELRKTTIISTLISATFIMCILYTIIFSIFNSFFDVQYKWFLVIYVIVVIFLQTTSGITRGLGDNVDYAAGNFLSAAITILLNVLFIAFLRLGVKAMLLSYIIGPLVGGIFQLFKSRIYRYIDIKKFDKNELRIFMNYSLPLIPNELSWSIIHASDRMIISAVLTVAANGLIAVASKFSVIYTTIFSVFNTSWTEQVVLHYKDNGGPQYISDMFEKVIMFFGCMAIGIIGCMPFVFKILVNNQFANAYNLIPLYMIAVFFNAVIGMISAIYLVENETKLIAISTMVAALINLIVDIILVKIIGIYAAPISSICGYLVISVWRLIDVNKRHCRIKLSKIKLMILFICLLVSLFGFYSISLICNIISFLVVVIISFMLNKKSILYCINMIKFRKRN
ncbi:lipopolysaccharide biosynthesis protein [Clostridium cadaveris]|uniref:lipopolysaccharide biosynthesis protein n=1 Tax=Clostridium cadaveris TaxID=1529 RepID=UPI003993F110